MAHVRKTINIESPLGIDAQIPLSEPVILLRMRIFLDENSSLLLAGFSILSIGMIKSEAIHQHSDLSILKQHVLGVSTKPSSQQKHIFPCDTTGLRAMSTNCLAGGIV